MSIFNNEAAERLRDPWNVAQWYSVREFIWYHASTITPQKADDMAKAIDQFYAAKIAAERRATVERIRERVEELGEWYHQDNHITVRWIDISAILDEEATR